MDENDIKALVDETVQEAIKSYLTPKSEPASNIKNQPDKSIFNRSVQILDGKNIQTGQTNGTTIATTTTQKIGFYGKTTVRAGAISAPSGGATDDSQARAAINSIITALHNIGIIG
jgi:hypothetical protein